MWQIVVLKPGELLPKYCFILDYTDTEVAEKWLETQCLKPGGPYYHNEARFKSDYVRAEREKSARLYRAIVWRDLTVNEFGTEVP